MVEPDWEEHWKSLVSGREAQVGGPRQDGFWDRRARRFARSMAGQADPFLTFLEPWLSPARTVIDVGAGTGRHASALAPRVDWVTAVEPSQAMRELIPEAPNMTVVASTWEDAQVAAADLVICSHVLYPIREPVPFLLKLESAARERVFIVMRDEPNRHPAELIAGPGRVREPLLRDCFNLLRQIGVAPDVTMFRYPAFLRFESIEAALEDCRARIGEAWDEEAGRTWLEERLTADPDGGVRHDGGVMTGGVVHWRPAGAPASG